jgi:phthalate 4,5-cis-dihydrodiol dehydrogenase
VDERRLRIGVCGLGRGFLLTAPTLLGDPRVRLVAAADPRPEARARFEREIGGRAYASIEALSADPEVDMVYVASPHGLHAAHAIAAARGGKHMLVEKPMALTLAEADAMIAAAGAAGVQLLVGPSHAFDAPIILAASLIASGAYGAPRLVSALNYNDFLYRPRRPEELDTGQGGGVIYNQAPHQVDVVRRLVAAPIASVRASAGAWDAARPTEGAYTAFLSFEGGAAASLTYSGYGRFDSDELAGWIDEQGAAKVGNTRRAPANEVDEPARRAARAYGAAGLPARADGAWHEHFGFIVVSCERADLRPTPQGVIVFDETGRTLLPMDPPVLARVGVVDALWAAVVEGRQAVHDGAWGRSTLEACLAILASSRDGREIRLSGGK